MKKIFTLVVMLSFAGLIFAQPLMKNADMKVIKSGLTTVKYDLPELKINNPEIFNKKSSKSTGQRWYCYALTMQNIYFPGSVANRNPSYLFPDTTTVIKYSNGIQAPWWHGFAVVLDPTDPIFKDDNEPLNITSRDYSYTIDSVSIPYGYFRTIPNPAIVDTLVVEIIMNEDKYVSGFLGMTANWGVDTTWYLPMITDDYHNYVKQEGTTEYKTIKIPLTNNDSTKVTNGSYYLKSKIITTELKYSKFLSAITYRFIPGYSWTDQDTLNTTLNYFMVYGFEEKGVSVPQYPRYERKKYNLCSYLTTESYRSGSFQNRYLPRLIYGAPFPYDNMYAFIHVKSDNVGITENQAKTVRLSQNIPNPADNSTQISYELKQANNVSISISDMTGREIMKINQGKQSVGVHSYDLNTSGFAQGLYYYTLNADNIKLTKKMMIIK